MPKARHLAPNVTEMIGIDWSNGCPGRNSGIREDRAPGINYQSVAMALPATVVNSRLRWGQHIRRVFNGPGLQKNLPVVFSSECCECCGDHQQICSGTDEMAIELRKPHVVANGQPYLAETRDIDNRWAIPSWIHRCRLAVGVAVR